MTLTADEITIVRQQSGDDCDPPLVSDTLLQLYDGVYGSLCAVTVAVIRARLADATKTTGVDRTTAQATNNPKVVAIKSLLDYWQGICPESWPAMGKSSVDLGIDEMDDDAV